MDERKPHESAFSTTKPIYKFCRDLYGDSKDAYLNRMNAFMLLTLLPQDERQSYMEALAEGVPPEDMLA